MAYPIARRRPVEIRTARIVVGIDPSAAGLRALRFAVELARSSYSEVHAVRAWTYQRAWHNTALNRERRSAARRAGEQCLAATVHEVLGTAPTDIAFFPVLREGPARHVLLAYAGRDDDRLVLGGRTGTRWTHGSGATTRHCVAGASHCVIVIPAAP